MIRKLLWGALTVAVVLGATGVVLYVTNAAPDVPALTSAEAARTDTPYIVKVHAQWCSVCFVTKDVWSEIAEAYAGRARFVVFDVTNDETSARSRVEAARLGLLSIFDEFGGATGSILVVDGATRTMVQEVYGSRDVAEYRSAIDQALANDRR